MNIVVTGITNVIFTILAMFVVDRWGRKALTLIGSFGLAVIYTFMGAAYYFHITGVVLLIIVVMAIACYAMTLATVMWVIISEIFPESYSWSCYVCLHFRFVGGLFYTYLYFPNAE